MTTPLKIIFAGTPEFAAIHLEKIIKQNKYQLVGVYTQPDRPAGRGKKLMASPVKVLAEQHGIPVFQPSTLKTIEAQQQLAELEPDLMVVVAYGLILPQTVLDIPKLGCINSHASLLPRWRGAAPIQRAIQAGDKESGVTVMQMEAGLDTGPMLLKVTTPITEQDTGGSLHDRLTELGANAIIEAIDGLANHTLKGEQQDDSLATYAHKLTKEEAQIDWNKSAIELANTVRAFNPWPICHTLIQGQSLKILEAKLVDLQGMAGRILEISKEGLIVACGSQALCLTKLQLPNSKPLSFWDVYNGHKDLFNSTQELGK
ncbi:methionyl-tRNA formyltransferase [Entomomonas sp. E2T0]|uniref:methionyl-tRNA formyltransferase n=1 Tax=Entomomonas sp. E2T0 TaxID=2930213 RepID=UPI0022280FD0|nr:methionyl-tRNA formyltransferase [Entomomonas sp. E2T0]UYZ82586.1 methionyl-tRNA formyltransferase [Entomomonas sp. E2T0]